MNRVERNSCRDMILDIIEAIRNGAPELFFEVHCIEFMPNSYHIEVTGMKKVISNFKVKKLAESDIFTMDYGWIATSNRVFEIARKLKVKSIDIIQKDFLDGLSERI